MTDGYNYFRKISIFALEILFAMSHDITTINRKNKNSAIAAFGFVAIIIVLIISAANYLRIQAPRFQPITQTERAEMEEAAHEHHAPAANQSEATPDEQHAH